MHDPYGRGKDWQTVFNRMNPDATKQTVWAPIMEKAFAKYHGNYKHIIAG